MVLRALDKVNIDEIIELSKKYGTSMIFVLAKHFTY